MKRANFYLTKVITSTGELGYIVDGWDNVMDIDDTPAEYDATYPNFEEFWNEEVELYLEEEKSITIEKGTYFTRKEWETIIEPAILKAGKNLGRILRKEAEKLKRNGWSGSVVLTV